MQRRYLKAGLAFLILFLTGWGLFALVRPEAWVRPLASNPGSAPPGTITEVAARVSPSIVGISNLNGSLADQTRSETSGSGVILDREGRIVTNFHVVQGAEQLIITLVDGKQYEASLLGVDQRTDLALIKIEADGQLSPAILGDSDRLLVGQQVLAIGNPLGLQFARSVTAGIVSGLNRPVSAEGFASRLIQTDAAINPGNSGGALVDLNGQVIGINTVKIAAQGFEGMGFSIPSNQVKSIVEELKMRGKVLRPLLGVRVIGDLNSNQARYFRLPADHGVIVEPEAGGAAEKAGLKGYDIITALDGQDIAGGSELQERVSRKNIGQTVRVRFIRIPEEEGQVPVQRELDLILDG